MGVNLDKREFNSDQDNLLNAAIHDINNRGYVVASIDKIFNWARSGSYGL